ncbi:MAG: glycosyl transferase [Actinomycetota bacterium]|nr:glycosyl transferase [Actinomycetota bacterium]
MSGSSRRLRCFLGAFGQPGHAFPMLALGARLAARGHDVTYETWSRWRSHVEAAGMRFLAAPEYPVFPTPEQPASPYEAVVMATGATRPFVAELAPDVVVHDILTLAPAMAAELEGIPVATLIPHLYPVGIPGFPPWASGMLPPRTARGRRRWELLGRALEGGLRRGREELNATRARLGLAPVERVHGGLSDRLCIVGTFPQLEYPRAWPEEAHVVGPLLWEPPFHRTEPPPGDDPLVLIAPSTAQDPKQSLLQAAVKGLARERVRVLATSNRKPLPAPLKVPANGRLVEWISYAQAMPECSLVVCHAGHGTLARALACGCPVVAVAHSGDMPENAARVEWAGVGVRLPWRLLGPRTVGLAASRALSDRSFAARAGKLAAWGAVNDGASRAASLVEELARGGPVRRRESCVTAHARDRPLDAARSGRGAGLSPSR